MQHGTQNDAGRRRLRRGGRHALGRCAIVASCLVLVGSAAACSDDDGDGVGGGEESTETTTTVAETTTTLSDEQFSAQIDDFAAAVAEAGTDLCAVIELPQQVPPPNPSSSEQVQQFVDGYYVALFEALAGSVEDQPEAAAALRTAAAELSAEAAAGDYSVDSLAGPDGQGPMALRSDELQEASRVFEGLAQERCGIPEAGATPEGAPQPQDPSAPTTPEGSP